jgi:predicted pyridoxine 5'-phosphate oxidase superfamily flavin-nucleotide-binding protein
MLLGAEGKALATIDTRGLPHVVPVSTVYMHEGNIVLVNYFLNHTLENIKRNNAIALTFWKGLSGYQVKATALYQTEGELFSQVQAWVTEILPTRVVKGILVLSATELYDISAGEAAGKKILP